MHIELLPAQIDSIFIKLMEEELKYVEDRLKTLRHREDIEADEELRNAIKIVLKYYAD